MKKTWVMLTSNNVKQTKSSNEGLSKEFIKDLYQRDCIAKEIFKNNQNKPVTAALKIFDFIAERRPRKY